MHYTLTPSKAIQHILEVECQIDYDGSETLILQLANCRPGRYEIANYAQNVLEINAFSPSNEKIPCKKISKSQWQIMPKNSQKVRVRFEFYANQLDAGAAYISEDLFYLNFINCLPCLKDKEEENCEITLKVPKNWQVASALGWKDGRIFARNYYELIDNQIIAAKKLVEHSFQIGNLRIHAWFYGIALPLHRFEENFSAFIKVQIATMKDINWDSYHFFFLILPYKIYHGVEHRRSTVIALGPGKDFRYEKMNRMFYGISSHEFFHAWNACRIRPESFIPYPISRENYFESGYILEGITTYYGDLSLIRGKVFDIDWYLKKFASTIKKHLDNLGRFRSSLAESSINLWMNGYKSERPSKKVSIYIKGCLCAFILDAEMRSQSNNYASLDNVMQMMWIKFGSKEIGYPESGYQKIAEGVLGSPLDSYFSKFIYGTTLLEEVLIESLNYFGLKLVLNPSPYVYEAQLGFKIKKEDGQMHVSSVHPNSKAYDLLSIGDQILEINDESNLREVNALFKEKGNRIKIKRLGKKKTLLLSNVNSTFFFQPQISKLQNASDNQKDAFKKWLWQEF